MDLEAYRKKLRTRIRICGIFMLLCLTVPSVLLLQLAPQQQYWHANDFITGALLGLTLILVFFIFRWRRALTDDTLCKRLYLKEYDEREIAIWQKASRSAYLFAAGALLFAGLAAGYFNLTVCLTLIGASLFIRLLYKGFYLYYKKHM